MDESGYKLVGVGVHACMQAPESGAWTLQTWALYLPPLHGGEEARLGRRAAFVLEIGGAGTW